MNLDQLRMFLAVARHRHFSRAADELYVTQPAVSAAVAKLENQFGVRLFHRIGRRVEITDVGRFLAVEGSRLLERVDLLERGLQDFNNLQLDQQQSAAQLEYLRTHRGISSVAPRFCALIEGRTSDIDGICWALRSFIADQDLQCGVLSLGASLTVGNYWLPSRIKAFWDRHAGIELRCSLANAEQVLEGTAQGQFDLCFLSGWPNGGPPLLEADQLSAEEVGQEQLLVVVGRSHPWFGLPQLAPGQLCESPWVMRERGSGAQSLLEGVLAEVGVPAEALNVTLVLNSSEMVKAIALEGGAAAALPETMVRQEVELGLLWPMPIEGCTRHRQPIWMVKHRQRYGSRLLLAFEELVRGTRSAGRDLDLLEEIGAGG